MNRIYKVVWSATRNTYVAVAEFAHAHGKSHSLKQQIFAALAAGVFVMAGMGENAYAAEGKVVLAGLNNIASGDYASVSGGALNTASGKVASVSGGNGNTASGESASVSGGIANKLKLRRC